ncbi:MAG: outer membrane beta-barrel domain-containing protein [Bdellovibrionota bacterium]
MKHIRIFLIQGLLICATLSGMTSVGYAQDQNDAENQIGNVRREGIDVVQNRLFRKTGRHEFTLGGGVVFDNPFLQYAMADMHYTYHFKESIGFEGNYARAFSWNKPLIDDLANIPCDPANTLYTAGNVPVTDCGVTLNPSPDPFTNLYIGNIIWSPIYGKFSIFSKKILHFDIFLIAGAGLFQAERSKNFGFNVGLGTKIHLNDWASIRIDLKNYTVKEGAPFNHIVNNRLLSVGLSLFLPPHPKQES